MSESRTEVILGQAKARERKHDWLGAIDCYTKSESVISSISPFESANMFGNLGYAYYRAAMQAEKNEEFKARSSRAIESYEKASQYFLKSDEPSRKPRMLRCRAMIAYINYWLASETVKKKTHINECWELAKKALEIFESLDEALEYGTTYNQLVDSALFAFFLEWDFQAREKLVKKAMDLGEQATELLFRSGNVYEQAKALAKALVCTSVFAYNFLDVTDRDRKYEKVLAYWTKARELDEEVAFLEILHPFFGPNVVLGVEGTDEAIENFEKALEFAKRTRDKFLIGSAFDWLTYHTAWSTRRTEGTDKQQELSEEAAKYARKAKAAFSKISFTSPRGDLAWIEDASQVVCFSSIMINETDLHKRRDMLNEALRAAPDMMRRANDSGYPETVLYAHHVFSFILTALTKLETNAEKKRKILNEALEHRNSSLKITSQIQPFMYWNRGVMHNLLATIRSELAELTEEPKTMEAIIREAVTDSSASLELKNRDLGFYEGKGSTVALIAQIAENQFFHGNLLIQLYNCTKDRVDLKKAFQSYEKSLAHYRELGVMSRVAECHWKMARIYDGIADHLKSAENFRRASISYRKAVKRVPQLKDFYEEHSTYMLSWSEIEKARDNHRKQNYSEAKEHFKKAAVFHKDLKQWRYLAPNYSAWALVEYGEELSRKDMPDEAIRAFEQAAGLFTETGQSIEEHLPAVESLEERTMATNVLRSTDPRYRYCLARISLEEGRLLDKNGDHYASAERYSVGAQSLENIETELEYEHDRREFRFMILVSRAWEKMMRAEAETSPSFYLEASEYFEKAREFSSGEKSRLLVLGHSRFCKALEAGMKIADVMDETTYIAAKRYLGSAANYYIKAGYHEASEYAKATELLLDAYWHIDYAKKEHDPEEKARRYMMAEEVLQISAGSFMKTKHFEKREQVVGILKRAREVRELAASLASLLGASRITSTRTAFAVPTPTYEEPVGLERFEHADIRANVTARQKELRMGENLDLEIQMVNAGKGLALLTKIKGVVPKGFELIGKPENCQMEDSSLNLKGKRLDSLRTEEVKLVLKSQSQGTFHLEPVVFYLDENGKYKTFETDPITLIVKEPPPEPSLSRHNLVDTGFAELDKLLYGGIPANCAVILASTSGDEKASLIKSFLETGINRKQTTFYLTSRTSGEKALAEGFQSHFYLFICNPQADAMIGNRPNIFKLKGIENLTEISIALASALNKLTMPAGGHRRACIDIVSDVLLQHHAVNTRRWLNALISQLKSKGFTILAVIDPEMHPSEEVHAILDVFDGEISIYEKETGKRSGKFLRILRMQNQEYSRNELPLRAC
jgi:KaiC/GvpD/RAD55 family RecA-like ATPase